MPLGRRILSQHPSTIRARETVRRRRAHGLCRCGNQITEGSVSRCVRCIENDKKFYRELRRRVIEHYGGKCNCCGEKELKFLAIDHIEGNGNQHRLSVLGHKHASIYRWLVRNNFPVGFQVLCHNCNMAKGCYGICPHQEESKV